MISAFPTFTQMSKDQEIILRNTLKDLELYHINSSELELSGMEEFKKWLKIQINYLLDKDFQRLLLSLYRIDVSEEKVKSILAESEPGDLAEKITDLIIERQLKKLEIRKKYSGPN